MTRQTKHVLDDVAASAAASTASKDATRRKLRVNTYKQEVRKGNTAPSTGWLHAAARVELLLLATRRLFQLYLSLFTLDETQVMKVRAALDEETMEVFIYPTDPNDKQGIPVKLTDKGRHASINLHSLLLPEYGLPAGQRKKFEFHHADPGTSPVGPALVFNLDRPLETKNKAK